MTIPAGSSLSVSKLLVCHFSCLHKLLIQLGVAANTIVVYHLLACRNSLHRLRLLSHREYIGVPQAVFGFEKVFVQDIIVRYMAIVARRHHLMRRVLPRCIVGTHHVTIDADLRIIRKVAVGFRHIYEVGSQPKYDAGQEHRPHLSTIRGEQTPLQRAYAGRKRMEPFVAHKPLFLNPTI